ncbi:MAG: hypothetical protein IT162_00520 [Bryobacterales bacterium]|nr:hypothetical protein [Bryobacterales bacterium]
MPELINLRPRHQSPLVLPYLPMPATAAKTTASTAPNPAGPTPIQDHPRYSTLLTWIDQRLIYPNLHLKETFHQLLRDFDNLP